MKKFTIVSMALGIMFLGCVINGSAQYKSLSPKSKFIAPLTAANKFVPKSESFIGTKPLPPLPSTKQIMDDPYIFITRYDLSTNSSDQNRIYLYPDGTIGATGMMAHSDSYTDRGTGYNYFDGTSWGPLPDVRIENEKAGWPSYAPLGTGEIVVTHANTAGLIVATCPVKGTGTWTTSILPGPAGAVDISWPRTVTNGPNHNYIHILTVTYQTYQGMTNQLLYYRSLDGGVTWDKNAYIIPGTTSADYFNFSADIYSWAEPHGDTLAFTVGDSWMDQFLMKSTDNGNTWTKTVIYHSLYNLGGSSSSYFYAPDGTSAIALDNQGIAHVVFGLTYDSGNNTAWYYNILAQGIVYWNENQPQLRQDLDPDSLLATGNIIAWVKDQNVFNLPVSQLVTWGTSMTSNPQLVIDKDNKVFLIWAGATSLVDANNFNLRHIYGRDGVITPAGNSILWHNDTLVDITGDWIQYNFSECMFPSASPTTDAYNYILFQRDDYGGSYVKGTNATGWVGQTSPDDNFMTVIKWEKPVWTGINEKHEKPTFSIGQNYPNPATGLTKVNVYMQNSGDLSLKVTDLTGQTVISMGKTNVLAGVNEFVIDASQLSPGVYFYTVKQGDQSITKKMIVQ